MHIVYFASSPPPFRPPFQGGEKVQEAKGVEWRGVERRKKKGCGKKTAKKVVGARAKVWPRTRTRTRLIVAEEKNLLATVLRAVAKEIHR